MAGELVLLAALFMQAYPGEASLHEVIAHLHFDDGVDARAEMNFTAMRQIPTRSTSSSVISTPRRS
jgi:hypothetical protein